MTRIGICEDDESVRRVLTGAFRMNGHEVVIARNGQEALRSIPTSAGIDVLVIDIGLPDSDGDFLSQSHSSGGLGLRATGTSALFLTIVLASSSGSPAPRSDAGAPRATPTAAPSRLQPAGRGAACGPEEQLAAGPDDSHEPGRDADEQTGRCGLHRTWAGRLPGRSHPNAQALNQPR